MTSNQLLDIVESSGLTSQLKRFHFKGDWWPGKDAPTDQDITKQFLRLLAALPAVQFSQPRPIAGPRELRGNKSSLSA